MKRAINAVLGSMLVGLGSYVLYRSLREIERHRVEDAAVDLASEDSFPASDPPSAGR